MSAENEMTDPMISLIADEMDEDRRSEEHFRDRAYAERTPTYGAISFADRSPWTAVSRSHLQSLSQQSHFTMATRVYFAALSRLEPAQYATFDKGELRHMLGHDGKLVSTQSASDAMSRAREAGLIGERSTVRKVWISDGDAQVGAYERRRGKGRAKEMPA